jgi:endonuclease G
MRYPQHLRQRCADEVHDRPAPTNSRSGVDLGSRALLQTASAVAMPGGAAENAVGLDSVVSKSCGARTTSGRLGIDPTAGRAGTRGDIPRSPHAPTVAVVTTPHPTGYNPDFLGVPAPTPTAPGVTAVPLAYTHFSTLHRPPPTHRRHRRRDRRRDPASCCTFRRLATRRPTPTRAAGVSFNQDRQLWLGLEDYLLDNAADHDRKLVVFTGPVLTDDDPKYRGLQIPLQFWKIGGFTTNGALGTTGYLLDQTPQLGDLQQEGQPPPLGEFRTFQVPLTRIAELTGLDLGPLAAADRMRPVAALGGSLRLRIKTSLRW